MCALDDTRAPPIQPAAVNSAPAPTVDPGMSNQRYIDLCRELEAATDEADVDRLTGQLDDLYRAMTADELRAVEAHFEPREPG